jgi:hypothetical protein
MKRNTQNTENKMEKEIASMRKEINEMWKSGADIKDIDAKQDELREMLDIPESSDLSECCVSDGEWWI